VQSWKHGQQLSAMHLLSLCILLLHQLLGMRVSVLSYRNKLFGIAQVVQDSSVAMPVRIAAAVNFKNVIKTSWVRASVLKVTLKGHAKYYRTVLPVLGTFLI
jgi:hypothetical protein